MKQARDNVSKVQALLAESFHHVTRAYTLVEALAAIAKQPVDLLLIDHEPASGESACPLLTAIMSNDSMAHIPSIGSPRPSTLASCPRSTTNTFNLVRDPCPQTRKICVCVSVRTPHAGTRRVAK